MESSYQKFTKDIVVIGIANLLVALSSFILLPLLTKTLGAHDYGIWAQVNVTIGLMIGFAGLGLPFAMTRFLAAKTNKEEVQDEFYSVFSFVFFVTFVISLLLIIFADFVAGAFFDGATQIVRITGVIILVWSLDMVYLNFFRARRQMKRYSIFQIATMYGQIGLIAYLVLNGHGLFSVVLSVLIVRGVILLVLFLFIKSQIGFKRPGFSRIGDYLKFGLPTVLANISHWVVGSSDRYVIGYFLGMTSVGIYSASYAIASVSAMATDVLGFVLPPTLSKLYDEGRMDEVRTHLRYSLKYFLALAIPFIFGAALLSEEVLRIFSTPEIASQGYFIMPLLALSMLLWGVYAVVVNILFLVKKTRIMGVTWVISALVNLGLNIVIVPYLGILGAAITTIIAYSLAVGITIYYSFKEFRFSIDWSFILKSLVASGVMALVVWMIAPVGLSSVVLTIIAGVIVYAVMLFLLRGFEKAELQLLKSFLPR